MTKNELLKEIKKHLNDAEIETLGITTRTSKEELQSIYDQSLHVHKEKPVVMPEKRGKPDESDTEETKPGKTAPQTQPEAPQKEVEEESEVEPETTEESSEEATESEKTEGEKPEETVEQPAGETDYDELMGKIAGAEVPHSAKPVTKPLVERKKRKQSKKQSEPESTRIEGYILLTIIDVVYPFTLSWLNNLLDKKGKRISATDLQLAQKDFDKLEPLADQAADYLAININPVAGFFLVATFMYANNLIAVKFQMQSNV